jgi:hypothetical protein
VPPGGSGGGPEAASEDAEDDAEGDSGAPAEQAAAPSAADANEAAVTPDTEEVATILDEATVALVDEGPSPQECNQTLAGLIAARRFSLAHHLAGALGQTQRAELFAEAAVAHGVRRATSPAARDVVDRAFGTLLSSDDRGSVALRAASVMRVALLAPASQAAEALRPILDPLGTASEALRDFALAVIDAASTGVTIPASGVIGGGVPAFEEADVIAAWAEDALSRPRSNRLYRGTEIWNLLTAPDQHLGRILAAVASNDRRAVPRVRKLCAEMGSRALDKAVDGADAAFGGRDRGTVAIMGGARAKLRRDLAEIVEQAAAWCEALGSEGTESGLGRLELAANELRQRLGGLVPDGLDPLATACLYAAIASLSETIGLLFGESLDGPDLDPEEAVHRELVLVNGLRLDEHDRPERPPTLAELVAASGRSRVVAFEHRLATWDFPEAEGIIALPEPCGGALDEAAATKELRAAMRDATPQIHARWKTVEAAYNAGRARGRLDDTDAAVLGGALAHAEPATPPVPTWGASPTNWTASPAIWPSPSPPGRRRCAPNWMTPMRPPACRSSGGSGSSGYSPPARSAPPRSTCTGPSTTPTCPTTTPSCTAPTRCSAGSSLPTLTA